MRVKSGYKELACLMIMACGPWGDLGLVSSVASSHEHRVVGLSGSCVMELSVCLLQCVSKSKIR